MSAAGDEHSDEHPPDPAGRLRLLVASLVGAEAALLLFAAAFLLGRAATTNDESPAELISLAVVAVVVGLGLALCARGVRSGLSWTRGPVLTWQLLQAAVGAPLSSTGSWWAGVPLLAAAVVVGVLIAGRHVIPRPAGRS